MSSGIIYKITNKINGKFYIGQTKNSMERRWSQHKYNAKSNSSKCLHLENAIRKHDVENFTIEVILKCDIKDLDSNEIKLINIHCANNPKFGYNICKGGGGSTDRKVTDEHRKKISKANRKSDLDMMNIQERKINGVCVGYVVSKNINNVRHTKNFANTNKSLEENLELAKQWLKDLDNGKTVDTNRYNRTINLPKNIAYHYNNHKEVDGYCVKIEHKGKRHSKSFTFKNISMEEKLQIAIEHKEQFLINLRKNQ